ncbi:DUF3467 domain-containing protein [Methanolapillus millepedarum]|uniref:DUF3467 domain-containing protein n=1 Tax=Methanolapillus millepedarum TaxID=3028296 RepID=A0AA96V2T0_9EURY|nr:hypothetical protein MsAc7_03920 [Methanosarcinaceae archaeon Ac7]
MENNEPNQKKNEPQKIEVVLELSKESDCKQFYAIGAIGVNNIYDFRISFYNDEPELAQGAGIRKIHRKIGTEIILSPIAALELSRWLDQNVKDYERKFGPIFKNQKPEEGDQPKSKILEGYA